jgi:hypothetical protein
MHTTIRAVAVFYLANFSPVDATGETPFVTSGSVD